LQTFAGGERVMIIDKHASLSLSTAALIKGEKEFLLLLFFDLAFALCLQENEKERDCEFTKWVCVRERKKHHSEQE
jgi:hypothetical protein